MLGAIIGGVMSAGGAIAGAIGSARAARKSNKMIADQKAKNQAWYDRRYNEDYTQRADAQAVLENTRRLLSERDKRASASNVVMGGTDEAVAMSKQASNEALAQTMAGINAQADQYKQNIEGQYLANDGAMTQQQIAVQQQKARDIAQAGSGMASAGGSILSSLIPGAK